MSNAAARGRRAEHRISSDSEASAKCGVLLSQRAGRREGHGRDMNQGSFWSFGGGREAEA